MAHNFVRAIGETVFKTVAFVRSATLPGRD
jgi:hypothetical protein